MINPYKILIFLFIPLFLFSCKKKELTGLPEGNDPVFKAEGTIDGESIALIAGENNAYMYTYTEKVNGVNKFTGKLSDGSTEIEFGIFDGNLDSYALASLDEMIDSIQWAIDPTVPLAQLSKFSFTNADQINSIDWYSDNVFIGTNDVQILKPGKYMICALVTFNDGTQSQLCNELLLGYQINANYTLRYNLFPNGNLNTWVDVENGAIAAVDWKIDGEEINKTESNITTSINNQAHLITATVRFTNGVVRTKSFLIDGSLGGNNIQDFSLFEITTLNKQSIKRDYNALVVVRNNNIEYRSDYTGNTSGTINASKIEYYGQNDQGNEVYKVTATINCLVKSTSSGDIVPLNFDTTIGIEIPLH